MKKKILLLGVIALLSTPVLAAEKKNKSTMKNTPAPAATTAPATAPAPVATPAPVAAPAPMRTRPVAMHGAVKEEMEKSLEGGIIAASSDFIKQKGQQVMFTGKTKEYKVEAAYALFDGEVESMKSLDSKNTKVLLYGERQLEDVIVFAVYSKTDEKINNTYSLFGSEYENNMKRNYVEITGGIKKDYILSPQIMITPSISYKKLTIENEEGYIKLKDSDTQRKVASSKTSSAKTFAKFQLTYNAKDRTEVKFAIALASEDVIQHYMTYKSYVNEDVFFKLNGELRTQSKAATVKFYGISIGTDF